MRLSYANVMATAAMFVALGGGAYAVSNVNSADIKDDSVKSEDLKDEKAVKGEDVKDGDLTGDDVDASSLAWEGLHVGGAAATLIRDIGDAGDTLYGGIYGRTIADADIEEVYMGVPLGTVADGLHVEVENAVSVSQTRTFTLLAYPSLFGGPEFEVLECTLHNPPIQDGGPASCSDSTPTGAFNGAYAIRIESSGAGLSATDDAYVGLALKAPADFE